MGVWVRRRKSRAGSPWVVVYDDHAGRRRLETFSTGKSGREQADTRAEELRKILRQAAPRSKGSRLDITLRAYATEWLEKSEAGLVDKTGHKRSTLISYRNQLANHILPDLGDMRIRDIHRGTVADFLERKRGSKKLHGEGTLSEASVATAYRILRALLERACYEGIIVANPAREAWQKQATYTRRRQKARAVDAANVMSRAEIDRLLAAAAGQERVMLATKYRAGLRMGELVALRLTDVDLAGKRLRIRESLMDKRPGLSVEDRLDTTKSGGERWVEIGKALVEILRDHLATRERENFANGWRNGRASWLFQRNGGPVNGAHLRFRFGLLAKKAGLSPHLTPHSLRHSYATHMLGARRSLPWVAGQLGHSSPKITLDHYAWAIPAENEGAADGLDPVILPAIREVGTTGDQAVDFSGPGSSQVESNQQPGSSESTRIDGLQVITGDLKRRNSRDKSDRNRVSPEKPKRRGGEGR